MANRRNFSALELTGSSVDQYSAPSNCYSQISAATACNKTGTARYVTVTLTTNGGTTVNLVYQVTIPPNRQVSLTALVGQVLDAGDKISALAEANGAIDLTVSGYETYQTA